MYEHQRILGAAGLGDDQLTGGDLEVRSPIDGHLLAEEATVDAAGASAVASCAGVP